MVDAIGVITNISVRATEVSVTNVRNNEGRFERENGFLLRITKITSDCEMIPNANQNVWKIT